jgi:hypothetical protein
MLRQGDASFRGLSVKMQPLAMVSSPASFFRKNKIMVI